MNNILNQSRSTPIICQIDFELSRVFSRKATIELACPLVCLFVIPVSKQNKSRIIKCHQASSSIIKHHQASSSIIKHHQASSNVIKRHQASSSVIKCHQVSSCVIKSHQPSSKQQVLPHLISLKDQFLY